MHALTCIEVQTFHVNGMEPTRDGHKSADELNFIRNFGLFRVHKWKFVN